MPSAHVEQDDVAQFLQADEQGERAADLAGADQRDLLASHAKISQFVKAARGSAIRGGAARRAQAFQTGCFFRCASISSVALAGAWSITKWPTPGSTSMA